MFKDWRNYRNANEHLSNVYCDLENESTISVESLNVAMCPFITEVKKLDGTNFPGKTLYDIVICVQFHIESMGYTWKLLNDEKFGEIRFTLDNIMKERTAQGVGVTVKQAQILNSFEEYLLWNLGLLGMSTPNILLNTVVFVLGKGCALRAGYEHRSLRSPPFNSQFVFLHDEQGQVFIRYTEDVGSKTNKGGLKHRKVEPKSVDIYPSEMFERCPVNIILRYLSLLPKERTCTAFYLLPVTKFSPGNWFQNRPTGVNHLKNVVKELCKQGGIPGYFTNHLLRSTCATTLYRANVDEQLIQEVTGHRSLAVRSYKRTSPEQKKMVSNFLFSQGM